MCFSSFLNCANGVKLRKLSHMVDTSNRMVRSAISDKFDRGNLRSVLIFHVLWARKIQFYRLSHVKCIVNSTINHAIIG